MLLGATVAGVATAGGVAAARGTGVLDDALRRLGANPHPEPDLGDARRVRRAADAQAALIASIDATILKHRDLEDSLKPLRVIADEQLVAVGGRLPSTDVGSISGDRKDAAAALSQSSADSAEAREDDAVVAVTPEVARVLASMSAGLSQLAAAFGAIA